MAPIRVGIIGLSATGTSATSWAERAHLAYIKSSPKYDVVAVCNSSVESSKRAIAQFGLREDAAAYGDPGDLAADPNVDLVVCCTRVDKHAETIRPSLRAGKAVFCEWPLGRNLQEAEELLELAEKSGAKTVVGLQAREAPVVKKLAEVVRSGRIGEVLSSTFLGSPGNGGAVEMKGLYYFTDREVGGNMATIQFGHTFDPLASVLGELESYNSLAVVQRKAIDIIDRQTNTIVEHGRPKNTFDHIFLQGELQSNQPIKPVLSYTVRGGTPFPGSQAALVWRVYGTKGEIQLTSPSMAMSIGNDDMELSVYENGQDKPEKLEFPPDESVAKLPHPARNIGRLYELYADGKGYPTFKDAVKRHRMIDEFTRRADSGEQLRKAEYMQA